MGQRAGDFRAMTANYITLQVTLEFDTAIDPEAVQTAVADALDAAWAMSDLEPQDITVRLAE